MIEDDADDDDKHSLKIKMSDAAFVARELRMLI